MLRPSVPALLLATLPLSAGAADYNVAPPAAWVIRDALPDGGRIPTGEVDSGSYWLLVDRQTRVSDAGPERYERYAVRMLNDEGVREHSQINVDFDPTYETLTLHEVRLIRNGASIDEIGRARTSLLQRETELEDRIYDGSKTLNLILEDVREGDTLVYAFTRRGDNPVLGGKYFDWVQIQWSEPLAVQRLRVLHPLARPIRFTAYNTETRPRITDREGERELLWTRTSVPALLDESDRPSWFLRYAYVQLSETQSWGEVANWADRLYDASAPPDAAVSARSDELRKGTAAPSDLLLRALRFVQKDIRYTGIEMGRGSHEPTRPGQVLARRFGDCKDKSLLLVALLRSLGISARPALVNTSTGRSLDRMLPSPLVFNHAIVSAELDGRQYWLDPTRSAQSGTLATLDQPDFGFALLVGPKADSLTSMPRLESKTVTEDIRDVFDLRDGVDEPATLVVTTNYYAGRADYMRSQFAGTSRASLEQKYLNFYARHYPVAALAPIDVADDEAANHFRTIERYRISKPFEKGATMASSSSSTVTACRPTSTNRRRRFARHRWNSLTRSTCIIVSKSNCPKHGASRPARAGSAILLSNSVIAGAMTSGPARSGSTTISARSPTTFCPSSCRRI